MLQPCRCHDANKIKPGTGKLNRILSTHVYSPSHRPRIPWRAPPLVHASILRETPKHPISRSPPSPRTVGPLPPAVTPSQPSTSRHSTTHVQVSPPSSLLKSVRYRAARARALNENPTTEGLSGKVIQQLGRSGTDKLKRLRLRYDRLALSPMLHRCSPVGKRVLQCRAQHSRHGTKGAVLPSSINHEGAFTILGAPGRGGKSNA